jgi:hypothetical protein
MFHVTRVTCFRDHGRSVGMRSMTIVPKLILFGGETTVLREPIPRDELELRTATGDRKWPHRSWKPLPHWKSNTAAAA